MFSSEEMHGGYLNKYGNFWHALSSVADQCLLVGFGYIVSSFQISVRFWGLALLSPCLRSLNNQFVFHWNSFKACLTIIDIQGKWKIKAPNHNS